MIRRSAYSLIHVGLWLRHLQGAAVRKREAILNGIETLESRLSDLGFSVSLQRLKHLTALWTEVRALPAQQVIGPSIGKRITNEILTLEKVVFSEAQTKHYFVISERRYNPLLLTDSPDKLLGPGAYAALPSLAQSDFREACQCLAFERSTAAAFHVLRATEGALKALYLRRIKRNRLQQPMWATMTAALRAVKRDPVSPVLLGSLDLVRTSYRNPTAHPEATYTLDQAEDLFGLCVDLLNKMSR